MAAPSLGSEANEMSPTLPDFAALLALARYVLAGYAAAATILTTACLALHAVTKIDRRAARRGRGRRPLFLPLEPAAQA